MLEEFVGELIADLPKRAAAGVVVGTLGGLFAKMIEKKDAPSPTSPPAPTPTPTATKELMLLGRGGIMKDLGFPLSGIIGIGTDPANCAIVYPKGTEGIAPLHCQLVQENGHWILIDFSIDGTWLKDERMNSGQSYVLQAGDYFWLASRENSFVLKDVT